MKIVRIIARLNVGGPARHVVWLTQALNNNEHQTTLIAGSVPPGEESMEGFAAANGVSPLYITEMSRELSLGDLVSLLKVYREIRRIGPDIVHTHTAKAGTIGRVAALLYRWLTWGTFIGRPRPVRVAHTFHGHIFHGYYGRFGSWLFLTIERTLARIATDRIVVISQRQRDEINGTYRVGRREQFEVIPLGIDVSAMLAPAGERDSFRDEIGAETGDIVVGYIGRLTEIKNLPLLIEAAALACDSGELPPVRFVIVGDGQLRRQLESRVAAAGLTGKFHFLGSRDDIARILAGTDILTITSHNEGTPLSLIEGLAAGVPFVSTSVGGVPDIAGGEVAETGDISVYRHGILTRPGSAAAFAEGLIYLSKNVELRQSMSVAGREFAATRLSRDNLVTNIRRLYDELVTDQRPAFD